jgi:hypothetical protein
MTVPSELRIQFSSAFTLFLVWLVFDFVSQFTTIKITKSDTVETGGANTAAVDDKGSFVSKAGVASNDLFKGFVLLSIAVFFNYFLGGNKASGDTFSLIAFFSAVLAAGSSLFGIGIARKGLWILFTLSIFAILVTAFATPFSSSIRDFFHF